MMRGADTYIAADTPTNTMTPTTSPKITLKGANVRVKNGRLSAAMMYKPADGASFSVY